MKALLIIDMQIGSFKAVTPRFDTDGLIYRINKLAAAIRENGDHTPADRPDLKAEKVIEHHNWIWENMTPTKGNVAVVEFEKVIEEFKLEIKRTS